MTRRRFLAQGRPLLHPAGLRILYRYQAEGQRGLRRPAELRPQVPDEHRQRRQVLLRPYHPSVRRGNLAHPAHPVLSFLPNTPSGPGWGAFCCHAIKPQFAPALTAPLAPYVLRISIGERYLFRYLHSPLFTLHSLLFTLHSLVTSPTMPGENLEKQAPGGGNPGGGMI